MSWHINTSGMTMLAQLPPAYTWWLNWQESQKSRDPSSNTEKVAQLTYTGEAFQSLFETELALASSTANQGDDRSTVLTVYGSSTSAPLQTTTEEKPRSLQSRRPKSWARKKQ